MTDNYKEKFPIGSQWKTRGARRAVVVGYTGACGTEFLVVWHDGEGRYADDSSQHFFDGRSRAFSDYDLIEPWKQPRTFEVYVEVWQVGRDIFVADSSLSPRPKSIKNGTIKASTKITLTEGEFDD